MSDLTMFNEFKKSVINDLESLNKRNDYKIKEVKIIKKTDGFEVIVFMMHDTTVLDGAIGKIIYKHKPIFAMSYGSSEVTIENTIGKKVSVRFTRRKYVE